MTGREEETIGSSTDGVIVLGEYGDTVEIGFNHFNKSTDGEYPVYIGITAHGFSEVCVGVDLAAARLLRDKLNEILYAGPIPVGYLDWLRKITGSGSVA